MLIFRGVLKYYINTEGGIILHRHPAIPPDVLFRVCFVGSKYLQTRGVWMSRRMRLLL